MLQQIDFDLNKTYKILSEQEKVKKRNELFRQKEVEDEIKKLQKQDKK